MSKSQNKATNGLKYEETPITQKTKKKPAERKENSHSAIIQPLTTVEQAKAVYLTTKQRLNDEISKAKAEIKQLRLLKRQARTTYKLHKTQAKIEQLK